MSITENKQFGVWMDNHKAFIAGREETNDHFQMLGEESNAGAMHNSSEKSAHNDEKSLQHKFFKSILAHMPNAEEILLTGTGTAQEQFKHYLNETAQFKNTKVKDSTSEAMNEEKLLEYFNSNF
jgi:ssDNA-specific exonuclease RecJ